MSKKLLLSFLIVSLLSLNSCSHIEDSNGTSNYNLSTLTDNDIINSNSSMASLSKSWSSDINGVRKSTLSISKFSGVKELDSSYIKNKTISYTISNTVTEGNFVVCIIYNDSIIEKVYANETKTFSLYEGDGMYILKIAGESANFKLEYEIR